MSTEFDLTITGLSDAGVRCSVAGGSEFWLPKKTTGLSWRAEPAVGRSVKVAIPDWLVKKHRQLAGDAAFDQARSAERSRQSKPVVQAEREIGMGGVLYREIEKKSDKSPDYRGRLVIEGGQKYLLAGWIKEGKKGKFLSLSVKRDEENRRG